MQGGHVTYDDHRRRGQAGFGDALRDRLQRRDQRPLPRGRRPLDHRDRCCPGATGVLERVGDRRDAADAHQQDQRAWKRRQRREIDLRFVLGRVLMPGHDGERRRQPTMRDGDARVRGSGDRRRHPGHDLVAETRGATRLCLLGATAKHERVAALQPDDRLPRVRAGHEQVVDLVLRQRVALGRFADVDHPRVRPAQPQRVARREPVIRHDRGRAQQHGDAQAQQRGVAGPGAHEVHHARLSG
jgi:hypothetical protein